MSYLFLNIYLLLKTGYFRPTRWPYRHLEITFWFYTSLLCCLCLAKVQGSTLLRITHALWVFGVLWNIFIVLLSKTNPEFWMLILSFSIFRFKIEYLSLSHSIRDVSYHSTILIHSDPREFVSFILLVTSTVDRKPKLVFFRKKRILDLWRIWGRVKPQKIALAEDMNSPLLWCFHILFVADHPPDSAQMAGSG